MTDKKVTSPINNSIMTTKNFKNVDDALAWLVKIYTTNTQYLRDSFSEFSKTENFGKKVRAYYPYIEVDIKKNPGEDRRSLYGYLSSSGVYRSTVTRPDVFYDYYKEQLDILLKNHKDANIRIGVSDMPIPIHFALGEDFYLEAYLSEEHLMKLSQMFDQPDLEVMDDTVPNGLYLPKAGEVRPISLFNAPRVDLSIQRLKHYTGTTANHFQKFVIFTNYQFYVDEFMKIGREMMSAAETDETKKERSQYTEFVEPGNRITYNENVAIGKRETQAKKLLRLPQMPAYHLKRPDGTGITMINIGVGPSNAKTITDHVAVLRSDAWLMLGHCAGLRNSQKLGDYVLAHAYMRNDGVLDHAVPLEVPVPALSEMQLALENAVSKVTGMDGYDVKTILRTGTVATVGDRNWELWEQKVPIQCLSQARAIALDMESATIATNGFRFRVPYGTLLCVSDKPLHGQLKLPGMADSFYRQRVDQHLKIGLTAMEDLRAIGRYHLHSRKLRSFTEVAFK